MIRLGLVVAVAWASSGCATLPRSLPACEEPYRSGQSNGHIGDHALAAARYRAAGDCYERAGEPRTADEAYRQMVNESRLAHLPPPEVPRKPRKLHGLAALGAGLLVGAIGSGVVIYAYEQHDDVARASKLADYDNRMATADQARLAGGLIVSLGATAIAAGVVLLLVERHQEQRAAGLAWRFAPAPNGALLGATFW
jgi:hypothetical protein